MAEATTPILELKAVSKQFEFQGQRIDALRDADLRVKKGEFICLIGASGCGKSTLLRIVAGFEQATRGQALMWGMPIAGPAPDRGMVFQDYGLFPWLTVRRNIAFGPVSRGRPAGEVNDTVERFLGLVGLQRFADAYPHQLSGGMKQRVGIARAFAIQPKMLLLDEPFGALDALTRGTIQDELVRICAATRQTVFMITHDVDEAILLSNKIMLMSNGPRARIAEIVVNTLPSSRQRETMHHDPQFYRIRNYLVDFLVRRSKELSATHGERPDTGCVAAAATRLVYPGLDDGAAAQAAVARAAGPNLKAIA